MKNIRNNSIKILIDVLENEKILNIAMDHNLDNILSEIDKKFVTKEVVGTIENLDLIDYVVNLYSKTKISKLNNIVKQILRVGIYELLFMDKIPSYATINELVNISKEKKLYKYSSYINAILRNVDRNITYGKLLNDEKIPKYIKYSIPKDIYDIYVKESVDIDNIDIHTLKKIYLRFNVFKDVEIKNILNEFDSKNISYKEYSGSLTFNYFKVYEISDVREVIKTDSFLKGYISIEDASSIYFIEKVYDYSNKNTKLMVLDACSSPGGKIIGLMNLFKTMSIDYNSSIRDITNEKINRLNENLNITNSTNFNLNIKDATILDEKDINKYDIVMCDVPCSGLGVIFKKPDIKYNFRKRDIKNLVDIQKKILFVQSQYVKIDGILSYSTCTINIDENENVIKEFLQNTSNFTKIYEKKILIGDSNKSDGFYFSILKRNN